MTATYEVRLTARVDDKDEAVALAKGIAKRTGQTVYLIEVAVPRSRGGRETVIARYP